MQDSDIRVLVIPGRVTAGYGHEQWTVYKYTPEDLLAQRESARPNANDPITTQYVEFGHRKGMTPGRRLLELVKAQSSRQSSGSCPDWGGEGDMLLFSTLDIGSSGVHAGRPTLELVAHAVRRCPS